MPLHPKSKIKLEDDLKLGGPAKAASLPGMGAGASTVRDMSGGPKDVTASGVTTNITSPSEEMFGDPIPADANILDERDGYKVIRTGTEGNYGTNLVGPDGLPATGGNYFVDPVTNMIQTREERVTMLSGAGGVQGAFSTAGTPSGVPTSTPQPRPELINEELSIEDQVATFDASEWQIDPSKGFETATTLQLKDALSIEGFDIGGAIDAAIKDRPSYEIPTQLVTAGFLASLRGDNLPAIGTSVAISKVAQTDVYGAITGYEYVYVNSVTQQALMEDDGAGGLQVKIANSGSMLHEQSQKTYEAALALSSEAISGLRQEEINTRRTMLQSELNEQAALEARIFRLQGDAELAKLTARMSFDSARLLQDDRQDAEAAAREDNQNFTASVENFKSENAFIMQGLNFEHSESMRAMELAWIHGSPEEAKRARLQTQDIERRQIKMQEREMLISTLAILGQHPQLRGAIKALGLFKGMEGGGDFDIDSFFNATLPLNAIPSAQEFNRLSPSAQEAMINDLAGKFGIKPETIMQTIRSQAPNSSRRLT
jgi:hypothetical protein